MHDASHNKETQLSANTNALSMIVLTNRRGVALCLFPKTVNHTDIVELDPHIFHQIQQEEQFEFLVYKNYLLSRAIGKTAENLFALYQLTVRKYVSLFSLEKHSTIQSYFVGTGAGSFTGLRLGCAFINGIRLAQECSLFSIQAQLTSNLKARWSTSSFGLQLEQQLGEYDEDDDSTGLLTFFDLIYSIEQIKNKLYSQETVLQPNYARLPKPLLTLNEKK